MEGAVIPGGGFFAALAPCALFKSSPGPPLEAKTSQISGMSREFTLLLSASRASFPPCSVEKRPGAAGCAPGAAAVPLPISLSFISAPSQLPSLQASTHPLPGAASWWDRSKKRGELIKARALPAKTWDCRVPVTAPGSPAPTPGRCERIFYPHRLGKGKAPSSVLGSSSMPASVLWERRGCTELGKAGNGRGWQHFNPSQAPV